MRASFPVLGTAHSITPFFSGMTPRHDGSVADIPVQHNCLSFSHTFEDETTTLCRNFVNSLPNYTASYPRRMTLFMMHVYKT